MPETRRMAEIRGDIHMEVLSAKLGILAGLFGVVGLIGLAALLGSVIWLIIRVANFDSMLPALLGVALSLALTVGGMVLTPAPEVVHMEPLKAPWTMVLERIARLREGRGKDGTGPGDDASPGDDSLEDSEEDGPENTALDEDAASPESGAPAHPLAEPASPEPAGYDVEACLLDWDVRMTLPAEWEETCWHVAYSNYIAFYQRAASENFETSWLFSVYLHEPLLDGYLERLSGFKDVAQIVTREGDATLISLMPSDPPEDNSFLDEYLEMRAAIPGILETAKLEKIPWSRRV